MHCSPLLTRRAVLRGVGHTAAFGALAAALPRLTPAAEQGDAAICLSMFYPNPATASFDADAWASRHLPLLRGIYGDSVERIELRMFVPPPAAPGAPAQRRRPSGQGLSRAPSMPGPPAAPQPLLRAAVSVWIYDAKAYAERATAGAQRIAADIATITSLVPTVQYDRIVNLLGEPRSSIAVGTQVVSNFYRNAEGVRFDADYYSSKVIPLMVKLYGPQAISRIEFGVGARGDGGGAPSLSAAAHYYIKDPAAWAAANAAALGPLQAELSKFTDGTPLISSMQVAAAG